jgi:hypothetical protein
MEAILKDKPAMPENAGPGAGPAFERAIILRPVSMSLGNIKTNIEAVLEAVREKSRQYQDVTKYAGDEKQAKDDRSLLRKQKDMTKTTIASIFSGGCQMETAAFRFLFVCQVITLICQFAALVIIAFTLAVKQPNNPAPSGAGAIRNRYDHTGSGKNRWGRGNNRQDLGGPQRRRLYRGRKA